MKDEIDLREMLQIFWRGKYLILGVTAGVVLLTALYFFILKAPVYESAALLDLEQYDVTGKEALVLIEQSRTVAVTLQNPIEGIIVPVKDVSVSAENEKEPLLQIRAKFSDPETCAVSVNLVGTAIIKEVHDYRLDKINTEIERLERQLLYLDDAAEEYLQSRDIRIMEILEDDPVYRGILEEKAKNLVQLSSLDFDLKELTENRDLDPWLKVQQKPAAAVPVNKKLKMAIALVLGLMLSIFIISLRHYLAVTAPAEGGQPAPPGGTDRAGK